MLALTELAGESMIATSRCLVLSALVVCGLGVACSDDGGEAKTNDTESAASLKSVQGAEWVGTARTGETVVDFKLGFEESDSDELSAVLRFPDPESKDWVSAGVLKGKIHDEQATLTGDSGVELKLALKGSKLEGTAKFAGALDVPDLVADFQLKKEAN